jgi:hypothetical protein
MNQIYVVIKTDYSDPYSDQTSTTVVRSFASFEAADDHANGLIRAARKRNDRTVQYEVESVDFENI